VPGIWDDRAFRARRRHPEPVAFALDHERRHRDRVELGQPALLAPPGRINRKREAEHGDRAGLRGLPFVRVLSPK
jgi:hypothetical protein